MSAVLRCTLGLCGGAGLTRTQFTHPSMLQRPVACKFCNLSYGSRVKKLVTLQAGLNGTAPATEGASFGNAENVVDLSEFLSEARGMSSDLVFQDFDPNEPVWVPPPPPPELPEEPKVEPTIGGVEVPVNPLLQPSAYSPEQGFKELSVMEVFQQIEAGQVAMVIDVREPDELLNHGSIAGAENIPLSDLTAVAKSGSLDAYKALPVVVICAAGIRSAQATVRLTKVLGFQNVSNMQGGVSAWLDAGLPLHQIN